MRKNTIAALVVAALVAGLALGTMGVATAATTGATARTNGFARVCSTAGNTIADIVAKLTNKTVEDVRAAREDGKSFADIAKASGVSADKVTSEVLAARKTSLDSAVKAGTITQAQADAMYARQQTRIETRVTSPAPANCDGTGAGAGGGCGGGGCGGGGGAGGGRGMMGGGFGGRAAGSCLATTTP